MSLSLQRQASFAANGLARQILPVAASKFASYLAGGMKRTFQQTKDICLKGKYRNRGQFQRGHKAAYEQARYKGMLPRLSEELNWIGNRDLSEAKCLLLASDCKTMGEFKKQDPSAYQKACRSGWLGKIKRQMGGSGLRILTYELCASVALKFETVSALKLGDPSVYHKIRAKGWRGLLRHMVIQGDYLNKLVYEIRRGKQIYIGQAANLSLRMARHERNPVMKRFLDSGAEVRVVSPILPIAEALALEIELIASYKQKQFLVMNGTRGGDPGGSVRVWTDERLKEGCAGFESKAHLRNDPKGRFIWGAIGMRMMRISTAEERRSYWEQIAPHFPVADRRNQGRRSGWLLIADDEIRRMASMYPRASDMLNSQNQLHRRVYRKMLRDQKVRTLAPHWKNKRSVGTLADHELLRIGTSFESSAAWMKADKSSYNRASLRRLLPMVSDLRKAVRSK